MTLPAHRRGIEWTAGNEEIKDYAEHQLATCSDAVTNQCKGFWSYLMYAGFNYHVVHHLFPTIDNHQLPEAAAVLE